MRKLILHNIDADDMIDVARLLRESIEHMTGTSMAVVFGRGTREERAYFILCREHSMTIWKERPNSVKERAESHDGRTNR